MSCRPTTRNKNKRHKPDETVEATSQTLRKIHSTGQVTKEDVMNMYMIWKPNCQGCRVNTKDNPNCLCGLIPPPNGSRKTGLWQKVSEIVLSLGKDPCEDLRVSPHSPAGLTNLGATCYANSILQCLYMNKSFREGIFSVELDILKEHLVLDQLARLFAQLHASKMAFIDSAPFIKTLELDNGVQQDSHEFLTLLLSLLEQCLSHSNVPKARTIVQYLFCGNVSHVTRCSKCGKESAASSNMEAFYEIELNVKGVNNLDESLDDYLAMEELHGENQYFCDSCNSRVDATRCIKLRTLPIVLNFQLKRCVFLPKTTTKKKITSAFHFPKELAMGQRMCEFSQEESIYDLSAVLLHKGTAVNSGHYVAHIKDVNTGMWWKFDDENVSNLGCHPFGEGPSIPASMSVQNGSLEVPSCSESNDNIDNRSHASVSIMQSSKCNNVVDHEETFSSCDAYMLMYNLKRKKRGGETTHMDCDASGMNLKDDRILSVNDVCLPSHLHKEMEDLNASYLHDCEKYKLKKVQELEHITERRQEVRSVLAEAPVSSPEEPYIWISTDWLRQWADNIAAPSIDNKSIQCVHGKVPVSKLGSMKRLSMKAWMLLLSKHGGGPRLSNDDCCTTCLIDWAHIVASADSYRDQRTLMKQLAEAALSGTCSDGPFYYVSRQWLQQWLRRKNVDSPCEADAGPTASIRCPHGELMPAQAAGAKRLLIPERLWIFFYESANAVRPEDPLGYSAFPSDSEPCAQCSVVLNEAACLEDTLREVRLKQRQNHEKLATGKSIALSLNCHYYLLPSLWLSNWRSHISASGKTVSSPMQPETLDSVINSLKCEKHGQLLQRPLDLTCKRGVICQKVSAMDGLTIITQNDWKLFCEEWGGTEEKGISAALEEWGGTEEKGISAALEFTNYPPIDFRGSCEEMPMLDENSSHHDSANDGNVSKRFVIKTFPVICEECIGEKASCDLMHKLSYFNEDICVCFVRGKDAPRSIVEASSTASDRDRRISKRARKTTFGNSVNLKVAGSTTLYQLKMMIWESFGVVRENQILHKGSEVLDSESATLADLNIFPGDTLWFTDSEIHEHRDIAEELVEKESVRRGEEGFRGTLLASNISSLVA